MNELLLLTEKENTKIIRIKNLEQYPLPCAHELYSILLSLPDFHPYKVALGLLAIEGLRPIELCRLTRDCFILDQTKTKVLKIKHLVYKAKNNKYNSTIFKSVEKPIYSKWLSDQIIGYLAITPHYRYDLVFPFSTSDSLHKYFGNLRKTRTFSFMLDTNLYTLKGEDKTQYRVSLYSLRRFAFTFHYWVTYDKDAVKLAKIFGHSKVDTTYTHYIYPKEAIGLTEQDIIHKVSIDEFLNLCAQNQKLTYWIERQEKVKGNQKSLYSWI